ncbi:MAG: hypothetical protein U0Z26_18960 [Anaerolineales bacterium]
MRVRKKNAEPLWRSDLLLSAMTCLVTCAHELPVMLDYKTLAEDGSLHNTPPSLPLHGGIGFQVGKRSKVVLLLLKRTTEPKLICFTRLLTEAVVFISGHAKLEARSLMNVPFRTAERRTRRDFAEAKKENLIGLKGHRSVGGMRASIYNAMDLAGTQAFGWLYEGIQKKNG